MYSLFATNSKGRDVFRAVMPLQRFLIILRAIKNFFVLALKVHIPWDYLHVGLNIMCLTDAHKSFLYNTSYLYFGKNSNGFGLDKDAKKLSKPSHALLRP